MSITKELNISKERNNNLFEKKIEEKLLERINRYYHDIKKMKKLIKKGFNSDEDFKNFYELYNQIEWNHDYKCIKAYINDYETLKKFTTYSFK